MMKKKAVLWKQWKISSLAEHKIAYNDMAVRCRSAVKKFNAAKELELIRKNNLGSFYNFVHRKLYSKEFESVLRRADVSGEKAQIFNDFLLVFSLLTMAALQSCLSMLTPIYV